MRRALVRIAAWLLAVAAPAWAADEAPAARAPLVIESCAGGPTLTVGKADRLALLDAGDREQVNRAMLARFPVLARDGFAPPQILLWQRRPDEWLYVSLALNPQAPQAWCFTATFLARVFEFTPTLTRKYFVEGLPA